MNFLWDCLENLPWYIYEIGLLGFLLPCYYFRTSKNLPWYVYEISLLGFLLFGYFFRDRKNLPRYTYAIGLLELLLFRYFFRTRKNDVLSSTKEMFSHNFLAVNPGFDKGKWEELALKMNRELHGRRRWKSRNFFSSGSDCHSAFRECILRPSLTPRSKIPQEAANQYKRATYELYESLLKDEFPSNPQSLPVNEKYGKFTLFVYDRNFQLKVLRWFFLSFFLLSFFYCICVLPIIYGRTKKFLGIYESHVKEKTKALGITQRVKFLATVTHFSPGKNLENWDQIASHMNWYLHAEGIWTGAHENFLDGKECLNFYESQLMALVSEDNALHYRDLRDIVRETNKQCAPF